MLRLFLVQALVVLLSFSMEVRAGSTSSFVSIPLEKVKHQTGLEDSIPSVVVHQQHANRGISRLARMKGEASPPDHDLWGKISSRLVSLPENSEFMLTNATGLLPDQQPGNKVYDSPTLEHRHISRGVQKVNSTAHATPACPNSLGLEIQSKDSGCEANGCRVWLDISNDMAKMAIGTPSRDFSLLVDSGSADFWVGGQGCQGNDGQSCGNHTFLGSSTSSTFKDLHQPWSIDYNTGRVSGTLVQDNISLAGLHLEEFEFGVASKESPEFTGQDVLFDGLAGVAKSSISRQKVNPLVEALHKSGAIKDSIVSFRIPRAADNKHDGEMTLGGMNPALYDARSIVAVKNVNKLGYWEAPIKQVKINGKSTGWANRTGVLDTGTVYAVHSQIPGAKKIDGSWAVPCKTNASLSLTFGSIDFPIDPQDLAFIPLYDDEPRGDCWSGISIGTVGPFHLPTTWLLGDTFLKNVYHSLNSNEDKDEITFAKLK
ncbi:putative aspartic-type endopeptidase CTSD [Leucoagaricus sp. SymC.cos]|nr:putative aspartic-type endopeptidase CTSD [Leucoagaricus sp. SymC.cos]